MAAGESDFLSHILSHTLKQYKTICSPKMGFLFRCKHFDRGLSDSSFFDCLETISLQWCVGILFDMLNVSVGGFLFSVTDGGMSL